jgi:phosphoribosyl 1,2-cyclic phosphodiesterase
MPLYFTSLNSGSNGNCYYVGNSSEAVLIDAGISCKETERRMRSLGLPMTKIKAIFITHEHTDHIRGLVLLAKKYSLPVYLSTQTLSCCGEMKRYHSCQTVTDGQSVQIGELKITAFSKFHDAAEPLSFVVRQCGIQVGVMTDIGKVCDKVRNYFSNCHAVFLESNYDVLMLQNGRYPNYLKQRIRGGSGHLSNDEALALFNNHRNTTLSRLILSHLSKENNNPILVKELFESHSGKVEVHVASRDTHSPLFSLFFPDEKKQAATFKVQQLAMFT